MRLNWKLFNLALWWNYKFIFSFSLSLATPLTYLFFHSWIPKRNGTYKYHYCCYMWGHTQKQKHNTKSLINWVLKAQNRCLERQQVEASLFIIATPLYIFLYTIILIRNFFHDTRAPWKKRKREEESLLHDRWNIRASLERI